jgi:hypothetical protein
MAPGSTLTLNAKKEAESANMYGREANNGKAANSVQVPSKLILARFPFPASFYL